MKTALRLTVAALGLAFFNLPAATLLVSLESTNPVPPYATWESAATNIQDALDAAKDGDTVLVTNGVYAVGGRDVGMGPSRVTATNAIKLQSVNGASATTIDGGRKAITDEFGNPYYEGVRCVYLGDNAVLSGFTLTNGYVPMAAGGGAFGGTLYNCTLTGNVTRCPGRIGCEFVSDEGGGASGATLYNCTLTGNSARLGGGASDSTLYNCVLTANSAGHGGGAYSSRLHDCVLIGNSSSAGGGAMSSILYDCRVVGNVSSDEVGGGACYGTLCNCVVADNVAVDRGGGAWGSTLLNCTLTGNYAASGGGASACALHNSISYHNTGGNYAEGTTLNYSCTTPLPTSGVGNITGPPLFMDMAAGDFRLREDSPCIDAGTNLLGFPVAVDAYFTGEPVLVGHITDPTDILGNTRFIDGNFGGRVAWDIGAYEFNSFKPPRFTIAPQRTSEGWTLNITGAPNKWVRLQRSGNLRDWEEIWSGFMWEASQQVNTDDTGPGAMFYRMWVQ